MKLLVCLFTVMLAIPTRSELKILSTPDGVTGPQPCALTCSGVARYNDTGDFSWIEWDWRAGKYINITDCGFVSSPVVTVTVRGPTLAAHCPPLRIWDSNDVWFDVVTTAAATPGLMFSWRCDVFWSAFGYNC